MYQQDILIAGDLNSDCTYLQDQDHDKISLYNDHDFKWLIGDGVDTTTGNTECSYDRQVLIESKLMILRKVWRYQVLIQRTYDIKDRPFNLKGGVMVFCFVQKFYFGQHKSYNIFFFCRTKREVFFQNLTLGYMTKTLNQIIFFFLHQNQNIFFRKKP